MADTFRIFSVRDYAPCGTLIRSIHYAVDGQEVHYTGSPYEHVKKTLRGLSEDYRQALAGAFDAACGRRDSLDFTGVRHKSWGAIGRVTLKPEHIGAIDTERRRTVHNGGKRSWEIAAYPPGALSFFGDLYDLGGREAAIIATALGMPSWRDLEAQAERLLAETDAA